ncbi:hypothetical protein pb186bvf_005097 [Paramecium bursaria]
MFQNEILCIFINSLDKAFQDFIQTQLLRRKQYKKMEQKHSEKLHFIKPLQILIAFLERLIQQTLKIYMIQVGKYKKRSLFDPYKMTLRDIIMDILIAPFQRFLEVELRIQKLTTSAKQHLLDFISEWKFKIS